MDAEVQSPLHVEWKLSGRGGGSDGTEPAQVEATVQSPHLWKVEGKAAVASNMRTRYHAKDRQRLASRLQLTLKPRTPAKARRLTPLWGRGAEQQT